MDSICQLLDAWNPFDNNVPEALRIITLPNTIECYMMEEKAHHMACIRPMQDKHNNRKTPGLELNNQPRKEVVDKFCIFCGTFGHITTNCELMAQLLIT